MSEAKIIKNLTTADDFAIAARDALKQIPAVLPQKPGLIYGNRVFAAGGDPFLAGWLHTGFPKFHISGNNERKLELMIASMLARG